IGMIEPRQLADLPVEVRRVRLQLTVLDPDHAGVRDLRLFRNGSLVRIWRGDLQPGDFSSEVPLLPGRNEFSAYAFSSRNIKGNDTTFNLEGAYDLQRRGVAYVVAIGINTYADGNLNLNFAAPDAALAGAAIRDSIATLKRYQEVRMVGIENEHASKAQ